MRPEEPPAGAEQLVVAFDRDSVAMGDDAVSHRRSWPMDPSTTFDDLVRQCVGRLAGVAGPVGWLLTYRGRERTVPFAFLLAVPDEPVLVHRLKASGGQSPAWHAERQGGVLHVHAEYHSGSAPVPLDRL